MTYPVQLAVCKHCVLQSCQNCPHGANPMPVDTTLSSTRGNDRVGLQVTCNDCGDKFLFYTNPIHAQQIMNAIIRTKFRCPTCVWLYNHHPETLD